MRAVQKEEVPPGQTIFHPLLLEKKEKYSWLVKPQENP